MNNITAIANKIYMEGIVNRADGQIIVCVAMPKVIIVLKCDEQRSLSVMSQADHKDYFKINFEKG